MPLTEIIIYRILLDAYSRRHEAQKIYLRQAAAQRWIDYREGVLQGQRPNSANRQQLRACDELLRQVRRAFSSIVVDTNPLPPPTIDTPLMTTVISSANKTIQELSQVTDEVVYQQLQSGDVSMGHWTGEDPSLSAVRRWVRARPHTT